MKIDYLISLVKIGKFSLPLNQLILIEDLMRAGSLSGPIYFIQ